jgi:hypothetical protein
MDLIPLLGTLKGFREQVPRVVFDLYRVEARRDPLAAPEVPQRSDGTS